MSRKKRTRHLQTSFRIPSWHGKTIFLLQAVVTDPLLNAKEHHFSITPTPLHPPFAMGGGGRSPFVYLFVDSQT